MCVYVIFVERRLSSLFLPAEDKVRACIRPRILFRGITDIPCLTVINRNGARATIDGDEKEGEGRKEAAEEKSRFN